MKCVSVHSNPAFGSKCGECGYFDMRGKGVTFCHFTGELVGKDDKPGDCAGFHVGKWEEMWKGEGGV